MIVKIKFSKWVTRVDKFIAMVGLRSNNRKKSISFGVKEDVYDMVGPLFKFGQKLTWLDSPTQVSF